jgi:hypothetical protein
MKIWIVLLAAILFGATSVSCWADNTASALLSSCETLLNTSQQSDDFVRASPTAHQCWFYPPLAVATFRALSCPGMALKVVWPAAWMSRTIGSTLAANCAACALRATRMRSTAAAGWSRA